MVRKRLYDHYQTTIKLFKVKLSWFYHQLPAAWTAFCGPERLVSLKMPLMNEFIYQYYLIYIGNPWWCCGRYWIPELLATSAVCSQLAVCMLELFSLCVSPVWSFSIMHVSNEKEKRLTHLLLYFAVHIFSQKECEKLPFDIYFVCWKMGYECLHYP